MNILLLSDKMKNNIRKKLFYKSIFLFSSVFLSTTSISLAQINAIQLEKEVEQKLSSYYIEPFKISADPAGLVTVIGEVSTLYDKLKIGELISQVDGVSGINNRIAVQTEPTADNEIKANIENELQMNNVILEPEKIKVEVNDGVANLSGTVSYFREKLMAQSIASWQDGVTDMTSHLVVLSPVIARSDDNLKEIVSDILKKHFLLEDNVKFDVNDGIVNLSGSVKSLYAKDHIQEEIQHILGVKDVVNQMKLANNNQ